MTTKRIKNVLFVCTGNTCRSPMAEALFNAFALEAGADAVAFSAGTAAYEGMPASIGAISAMQEAGIDLAHHAASAINRFLVDDADVILCMQESHVKALTSVFPDSIGKIHTLLGFASGKSGSIQDPFGGDREEYEACASQIADAVMAVLRKISVA